MASVLYNFVVIQIILTTLCAVSINGDINKEPIFLGPPIKVPPPPPIEECITCGKNEVITDCVSVCPENCEYMNKPCDWPQFACVRGCQCAHGYIRVNGNCVKGSSCRNVKPNPSVHIHESHIISHPLLQSKECKKNEVWSQCNHHCRPSCKNPQPICTRVCIPGCVCQEGFILHGDKCVRNWRCPLNSKQSESCASDSNEDCSLNSGSELVSSHPKPQTCKKNEIWSECGALCRPTCEHDLSSMICLAMCVPGCVCKDGFVLHGNKCISRSKCPTKSDRVKSTESDEECEDSGEQPHPNPHPNPKPNPMPHPGPHPHPIPEPHPHPIPEPHPRPNPEPLPLPHPVPHPLPHPIPEPHPHPNPEPLPVPHPVPHPHPIPEPHPHPNPEPLPVPHPVPHPHPIPEPHPHPNPETLPLPHPVPHPHPIPEPHPHPNPEPLPVPHPIPHPHPIPEPHPHPNPEPHPHPNPEPLPVPHPIPEPHPHPIPEHHPHPNPVPHPGPHSHPIPEPHPHPNPEPHPHPNPEPHPMPHPEPHPHPNPEPHPHPVPTPECGKNQIWTDCGSSCPPTCEKPNPICNKMCKAGCVCKEGYILNAGECIRDSKCPKIIKPDPEPCPSEPEPIHDPVPKTCGKNEEWLTCGTHCPPTCDNPNPICIESCKQGCFCKAKYVLHNGECIRESKCPSKGGIGR